MLCFLLLDIFINKKIIKKKIMKNLLTISHNINFYYIIHKIIYNKNLSYFNKNK